MRTFFYSLLCCLLVGLQLPAQNQWQQDYASRKAALPELRARFDQVDRTADTNLRAALQFLYAYMPLSDLLNHEAAYFLQETRSTLQAQQEMPWGKRIPEREWRHFVLPLRINNEALDAFRSTLYAELRDRVRHLDMEQAVLEVNRWCHEKATYKPSDARTSSPLATLRTATGRCGEESTLTVAALRAVGIPARQVYTPRWAHTDDNHAWVEAWVEGKWRFLGACEPEPVLDLGWFNSPASRGMLMHTRVFGRYDGSEDKMERSPIYTEINVTPHYAHTTRTLLHVVDEKGKAVADAKVAFKIYNYAEFYSVSQTNSNARGEASLLSGKGDFVVWASKGDHFGLAKVTAGSQGAKVVLDKTVQSRYRLDFDLVPPRGHDNLPKFTPEAAANNERRKAQEDSIRHAYVATFPDSASIVQQLKTTSWNTPEAQKLVQQSRGNYRAILNLLRKFGQGEVDVIAILRNLTEKDLRDLDETIVTEHLKALCPQRSLTDWEARYRYSPRIATEALTPWAAYFKGAAPAYKGLSRREQQHFESNPRAIIAWIEKNIQLRSDDNPKRLYISPIESHRTQLTDAPSRDLLFVAMARSFGTAARIDEVTGKAQYAMEKEQWQDVQWTNGIRQQTSAQSQLSLLYSPQAQLENPRYYSHFSLSRLDNGLMPQLLSYPEESSYQNTFAQGANVDAGHYLLVSGTRMADGSVLAHVEGFPLAAKSSMQIPLVMRHDEKQVQVIGGFNSENRYTATQACLTPSILSTTGRGYFVVGLIRPNHEPTNHILHDLSALKQELEAWGRPILLLFSSREEWERFEKNRAEFQQLPSTLVFGIDTSGEVASDLRNSGLMKGEERPMVIIADTFNRVVFSSQGYTIGLGEQIKQVVSKLQ